MLNRTLLVLLASLTNTFATIDRQHGPFDGFVRDSLKLSAAEVSSLRSRLLQ